MAYHFANEDLSVVRGKGIDELDSCAYTVLAALFSAVEAKLQSELTKIRAATAQRKKKNFDAIWGKVRTAQENDLFSEANLGPVLAEFGISGKKVASTLTRVQNNVKLNYYWKKAVKESQDNKKPVKESQDDFCTACAALMANLDLADMPGNQCTALVRHQRTIYVTGNGLWESGGTLEQNEDQGLAADRPWFSTATQCQQALETLAPSIVGEYNIDELSFVIPSVGDMGGKFHAEMQLLEYMLDNNIIPERGYIGVSKPCCSFCQTKLNAAGLIFWTGHGLRGENPNDRVDEIFSSYKDPTKVESFKSSVSKTPFYGIHG